jgi:hypothetical protein
VVLLLFLFCHERERVEGVEEKMWYLRERNDYEK